MKKILLLTVFLVCSAVLFTGCSDDDTAEVYTITVTGSGDIGTAAADKEKAEAGSTVKLTATPKNGYIFSKWIVESGDVTIIDAGSNPATFKMPAENVIIKATFVSDKAYTITVTDDGNGTAQADKEEAAEGTEIKLTATPKSGYLFAQWVVEDGDVTIIDADTTPASFTMPAGDVTIKAKFVSAQADTYTITVNNDGQGTATANKNSAAEGMLITLNANPNEGFEFAEWLVSEGGITIADPHSKSTTFTMPANEVVISATFTEKTFETYKVTVIYDDNGTATANITEAQMGDKVTLTAIPNSGYQFNKWSIEESSVVITKATANPVTFTMPAEDVTIKAEFAEITYTVKVSANDDGKAIADKEKAVKDEVVTLTATSGDEYTFSHWEVESGNVTLSDPTANPLELTMPAENIKIKAVFIDKNLNVFEKMKDSNFLAYCRQFDTNNDGKLSLDEAAAVKTISVNTHYGITSLAGIEYFTSLETLQCYTNKLTSLDISKNKALIILDCHDNKLTSLDVSNNKALKHLSFSYNKLSHLDVSQNTALTYLNCHTNDLVNLNVSNNTGLTYLACGNNDLIYLDVSNNRKLEYLSCGLNQLNNLDLSNNTALTVLWCSSNNLTSLDFSNNQALTEIHCSQNNLGSLDLSNHKALEKLDCGLAQLTYLNVSGCDALKDLSCNFNKLTSLDVRDSPELMALGCHSNQLTGLDVSNNTKLEFLNCGPNNLTSLDVSNNTKLEFLNCAGNNLTSLDISKLTSLRIFDCFMNQLTELDASNMALNDGWLSLECGRQMDNSSSYQELRLTLRDEHKVLWNANWPYNEYVVLAD